MVEALNIDWNVVVDVLDELSDGNHSLLTLSYMTSRYQPKAFLGCMLFLADRDLIALSIGLLGQERIPAEEWPDLLRRAFGGSTAEHNLLPQTDIELSEKGELLLSLLNVGHPPLSR